MTRPRLRFGHLDLIRGIASIGVLAYHFLYGFAPAPMAPDIAGKAGLIVERPFLVAIVNGPFLVALFFVLSSFALTCRIADRPDPRAALVGMAKRLPRLLPLTIAGSLLGGTLFSAGWLVNREAARLTGSSWLERSGGVKLGDAWPEPSIWGAAIDSLVLFARGLSQYDSALWTMRYELIGSVAAIATALLINRCRSTRVSLLLAAPMVIVALDVHPLCAICVGMTVLTQYLVRHQPRLSGGQSLLLLALALLLGSTYKALPPELLGDDWMRTQILRANWLIHGAGAMLLFVAAHCWTGRDRLDGTAARRLGRLSFAVYVLHVPVQGSVASATVLLLGYDGWTAALAFLLSTAATFLLAIPLARLDDRWVAALNRWSSRIGDRRPAPATFSRPAPSAPAHPEMTETEIRP